MQGIVKFGIGLGQGYVEHGDEGLLDARGAFQEGCRELLASEGLKDGGEEGRVELADVGDRDSCRGLEDLVLGGMVNVQEKGGNFQGSEVATCTNGLGCNVFDCFAGIESDGLLLADTQAFNNSYDCSLRYVPYGVSLFIIELGCSIE